MNLTCQQSDLLEAVQVVSRAVATKSPLPVLEGILFQARDNEIVLTATDTHLGISTRIDAIVADSGEIVLPGRLFVEVMRKMPEGVLSLHSDARGAAQFKCLDSRTTLQGQPATDFPPLPTLESPRKLTVPQNALRDMIRQTSFALSTDDARPILTGCLFEVSPDLLRIVALDGFRLALRQTPVPSDEAFKAVVPGRPLNELSRTLSDDDRPVTLDFSDTHMCVQLGPTTLVMRLLEGDYIQYERILPSDYQMKARVDRRAFESAIERASLLAREGKNNLVRLHLEGDILSVTSNSEMGDVYEELPVLLEGRELDIAFNVRFLSDMLKSVDDDEVVMHFISALTPCVVRPLSGDDYVYLLLPVRVAGGA